ncbi:MAG TPA: hypothetical protein VIM11_22405 [Tepidisphaeraceae bacterium]|jgi:probable HAF family extracellular repeat protein
MKSAIYFCALSLTVFPSLACADVGYAITPICRQTADEPQKYSINYAGDLVGTYGSAHGLHAFLFSSGAFTDLGTGNVPSYAQGINSAGQIVMNFGVAGGDFHGGFYDHGVFTDLTNLTAGNANGPLRRVTGINDLGHIVGINGDHAAMFDGNTMTDLGTIGGGMSEAIGINNSDHIAGWIAVNPTSSFGFVRAFYYDSTLHDLSPAPDIQSFSRAINASNQIVGGTLTQTSPGGFTSDRAFLYANGTMTDLGSLGGNYSEAEDINDQGQVVGWTGTGAFSYAGGTMTDLNTLIDPQSGWHLDEADAINSSGQIVALANAGKLYEVLLLTPVPEPGMGPLGLAAGIIIFGRRRRSSWIPFSAV